VNGSDDETPEWTSIRSDRQPASRLEMQVEVGMTSRHDKLSVAMVYVPRWLVINSGACFSDS